MAQFEAGKTYTTRSICDHDCIISLTVIKRTAKTITADLGHRGVKVIRIKDYDGDVNALYEGLAYALGI